MIPLGGLKPGKTMPEIAMRTLDDKLLSISSHKGKTLLLALWTPWHPASGSENESLKETFESFKNDSRFAMVSLCLNPDAAGPVTDFIKTNNLSWTQARLADVQQAPLFQQLGLNQMPAIYLVGPDGKLIASELRGPAIKKSVEDALSKHPNAQTAEAK
jgi:peroxiredoxin